MSTHRAVPISILAELFPTAFVVERGQSHKPLKIGIDADLIATGLLTPHKVRAVLHCYTKAPHVPGSGVPLPWVHRHAPRFSGTRQ